MKKKIKDCTIDEIIKNHMKWSCSECVFYNNGISRGKDLSCSMTDIFFLSDAALATEIEIKEADNEKEN